MRDFKVVKNDQNAKRVLRKIKHRLTIEKPSYSSSATNQLPRPYEIEAPKTLPVIDGGAVVERSFEALSSKWHQDTVVDIHEHSEFEEWSNLATSSNGPILFRMIEDMVPEAQQFALSKEFLQLDLQSHQNADYPYHLWRDAWNEVLACGHWEEAKDILRDEGVISRTAGNVFRSSAIVIVAENQLRDCQARIDFPERFSQPLSRSSDVLFCEEHEVIADACGCCLSQPYSPDAKYKDILEDFEYKASVDPSFYKYALKFKAARGDRSTCSETLADKYRQKYLELLPKRHTELASLSPEPESSTSSHTLASSSRPQTGSSTSSLLSPITTRSAVTMLVSKWKSPDAISSFTEYAQSLLTLDGNEISIFEASSTESDNLFGVIHTSVAEEKQIPIVRQLLDAFANTEIANANPATTWWRTVYNSSSWSEFLARLNRRHNTARLESIMSPAGAELFLNSATLAVGETLLQQSSQDMKAWKKVQPDKYSRLLKQYNSIIGEFNARKISVENAWLQNLLNVM